MPWNKGYEILNIESDYTEADINRVREETRLHCIEMIRQYKNHPDKEKIWAIITTRGEEKMMFGPCPVLD